MKYKGFGHSDKACEMQVQFRLMRRPVGRKRSTAPLMLNHYSDGPDP